MKMLTHLTLTQFLHLKIHLEIDSEDIHSFFGLHITRCFQGCIMVEFKNFKKKYTICQILL